MVAEHDFDDGNRLAVCAPRAPAEPASFPTGVKVIGSSSNGMKLTSKLLLDQLLAQFLPGFDHQRDAFGPPLLDPWLHPMRSNGVDDQRF